MENNWIRDDCLAFYQDKLLGATFRCKQRIRLIRLSVNHAHGLKKKQQQFRDAQFLVFGVYQGQDMARIAAFCATLDEMASPTSTTAKTTIHGFDSFQGLPEDWKNGKYMRDGTLLYKAGAFDLNGEAPVVDRFYDHVALRGRPEPVNNVVFHKGWFDSTVPSFLDLHDQPVAFIHADADLYSSTKNFLDEICRRRLLKAGSVILFDEYWNYEHWEEGEYKAWMEVVNKYTIKFCYLGIHAPALTTKNYARCHYGYQSVCVLIQRDPR
jgi:hypothetical protein